MNHLLSCGGPPDDVGERIELGCAALGISLRELGVRAGLPPKRIYLIRTRRSPVGAWAEALSAVLGCDAQWLRTGEGDAPPWGMDRMRALLKRSASRPVSPSRASLSP